MDTTIAASIDSMAADTVWTPARESKIELKGK
jgi:hypothetical protein